MPFIGYGSVEKLVEHAPAGAVIYLDAVSESFDGGGGPGCELHRVVAGWVEGMTVHYHQFTVGRVDTLHGRPFGPLAEEDAAASRRRSTEAVAIVRDVLAARGLDVREGTLAFPADLKRMSGWPDCLRFDKQTGHIVRVREAAAAAEAQVA